MHPHSLAPGALACTFSLTPTGLGCKSGPAPRCPSLQCLGAPARAARLQQRLGEAPSPPHPPRPDAAPDLSWASGLGTTTSTPRRAHSLSRVALLARGLSKPGRAERTCPDLASAPHTLPRTLLLTCWCRPRLPPPSAAPAEAAAPGSVRTRRGGRWRSGQRHKS